MNKSLKTGLIAGGVIISILIIVSLIWGSVAGLRTGSWGMIGPSMMGNYAFGWFMPLGIVVFWGLIIWGIVALTRHFISSSSNCATVRAGSGMEILKTRYAHGEISKQEFEEKRKDLI